ncbi:unnamed protein product, partial [Closterium sp. Naga37s-1]
SHCMARHRKSVHRDTDISSSPKSSGMHLPYPFVEPFLYPTQPNVLHSPPSQPQHYPLLNLSSPSRAPLTTVTGSFTLLTWHMNKHGIPFAGDEFVRGIIASFSRDGHNTIVLLLKHIAFWLCG